MSHSIVSLKAYGDFTIACCIAKQFQNDNEEMHLNIIAGEHVKSLARELDVEKQVYFIRQNNPSTVPAVYDIKRQGFFSALKSAAQLSFQISRLSFNSTLVFDRLGWRERIFGIGKTVCELPQSFNNIYIAYNNLFEDLGYNKKSNDTCLFRPTKKATIIPGAGNHSRTIPSLLCYRIHNELISRGVNSNILLLEGQLHNFDGEDFVETIPKNFNSLISEIKNSDLVISADSLPAHLCSFFQIPVFVFTPIPDWSIYWLPESALVSGGMAGYEDTNRFSYWLESHLNQ